tara:strand:- start:496 stop:735 length:240 start_codon:yes stop_codon:yes gene_type:complete
MNAIEQLIPIFKEVFNDDDLIITYSTTAKEVDGWDSLAHIRLIVAIEKSFNLRFTAAEISELENVGEMINLILKKKINV